jgi:3-dehydroquinate synthase
MSDAAIGGKTAINLSAGKNLVGTFHRPCAVIQWTGVLGTLSEREHRSGLAEVVKSAWVEGPEFLEGLEARADELVARDPAATSWAVSRAAGLKARIVAEDELEGGVRRLLNLGHTFGHALERSSGYGSYTHGESVSVGMVMAFRYGESVGFTPVGQTTRLISILRSLKLPEAIPSLRVAEWLDPILRDKKRSGEAIRLILCRQPGVCETVATPISELVDWVNAL